MRLSWQWTLDHNNQQLPLNNQSIRPRRLPGEWTVDREHFALATNLSSQGDCLESGQHREKQHSPQKAISFSLWDCQIADTITANILYIKHTVFPASTADTLAGYSLKTPSNKDIHTLSTDINIYTHTVSQHMNIFPSLEDQFYSASIFLTFQYLIHIAYKTIHAQ